MLVITAAFPSAFGPAEGRAIKRVYFFAIATAVGAANSRIAVLFTKLGERVGNRLMRGGRSGVVGVPVGRVSAGADRRFITRDRRARLVPRLPPAKSSFGLLFLSRCPWNRPGGRLGVWFCRSGRRHWSAVGLRRGRFAL